MELLSLKAITGGGGGGGGAEDLTSQFTAVQFNVDNLNFHNASLLKIGNRFNLATSFSPKTQISDRQSTERKVCGLPSTITSQGYLYGEVTTVGGVQTSEENRKAFYDPTGSHYINPNNFTTKKVTVSGCADIRCMYTNQEFEVSETPIANKITHNTTTNKWYDGTTEIQVDNKTEQPTYTDFTYVYITTTNKLYKVSGYKAPQRINESTYELWFNEDGTPDFNHTVLQIDSLKDYAVFRMHLPKTEVGSDYVKVKDTTGLIVYKYIPFYQMDRILIKTNPAFLYQYELQKQGCNVDSTGKFCDVTVTPSFESTKYEASQPFDGTVTWTPKQYLEETKLEIFNIKNSGIFVRGNTTIKKIVLSGGF